MLLNVALQDAVLATLSSGQSSGYDLAKSFDVKVANFWAATSQQLYRELDKMEAAGLIEATTVEQARRPTKRMFALTDEGRAALRSFATRTPKPTAVRDDLLVQVEAMDLHDSAAIDANVRLQISASEAKLARYERRRDALLVGRTETEYFAGEEQLGPLLTLMRGISFERQTIAWCEVVLAALAQRTMAAT